MAIPIQPVRPFRRGRPASGWPDGLTREQRRDRDDKATAWAFVWILFTFKAATALVIWIVAARSAEASAILGATHWFWLILPIVAVAGPLVYQVRVRRVRRRRRALQRAEWLVSTTPGMIPDVEALRRAEWMLDGDETASPSR